MSPVADRFGPTQVEQFHPGGLMVTPALAAAEAYSIAGGRSWSDGNSSGVSSPVAAKSR